VFTPPLLAVVAVASALASASVAAYVWRYRTRPDARWFTASLGAQSLWCLTYAAALAVPTPDVRVALELASLVCMFWVSYPFLGFALEYTGYLDVSNSRTFAALAALPFATSALAVTAPFHDSFWTGVRVVDAFGAVGLAYALTPLALVLVLVVVSTYATLGSLLLIDTILSYGRFYRTEALAVGLSVVPPGAGLAVWLFGPDPVGAINWAVALAVPHALLDAYAFVGTEMFEASPATRRVADEQSIDALPDPVLVVDDADRLVDYNAAARAFPGVADERVGRPIGGVLDEPFASVADDDDRYLTVDTDAGRREFDVQTAPLVAPSGREVGATVLFRDVTDERERRQRLEVLNRILRHNLRNKLTTVIGSSSMLEERLDDPENRQLATYVRQSGEALQEIGEKARRFDALQRRELAVERVDLAALVDDVLEPYADRADVAAAVSVDAVTDRETLSFALENLVENAVEHGATGSPSQARENAEGSDDPRVRVSATAADRDEYAVRIDVSDDGPGIPETELDVLSRGYESSLEHGSGIGLWIVVWCLARLGGDVTFETDESGTTVTLWLSEAAART